MTRVVGAALVAAVTIACGGSSAGDGHYVFAAPDVFAHADLQLAAEPAGPDIEGLVSAVVRELENDGFEHSGTDHESVPGAAIVRARSSDGSDVRRAIVIVVGDAWTSGTASGLLAELYMEPGSYAHGPAGFAVVGPAAPFAIDYLFGNTWWGRLESELFVAFADPGLELTDAGPYIAAARAILAQYGAHDLVSLEQMLSQLPRPEAGASDYQPVATLLAIGLLLGDGAESRHSRLEWVPGEEALARYFALRDRRNPENVLRPIDYLIQLYRTPIERGLRAYDELVDVRFGD